MIPYENRIKLINAQTILPKDIVEALKIKTHKASIKEALAEAAYYYLKNVKEN